MSQHWAKKIPLCGIAVNQENRLICNTTLKSIKYEIDFRINPQYFRRFRFFLYFIL